MHEYGHKHKLLPHIIMCTEPLIRSEIATIIKLKTPVHVRDKQKRIISPVQHNMHQNPRPRKENDDMVPTW